MPDLKPCPVCNGEVVDEEAWTISDILGPSRRVGCHACNIWEYYKMTRSFFDKHNNEKNAMKILSARAAEYFMASAKRERDFGVKRFCDSMGAELAKYNHKNLRLIDPYDNSSTTGKRP